MIFSSRRFLQKTNERILFTTTMKSKVDFYWFIIWRKLKTSKEHFEIIGPLRAAVLWMYAL